MVILQLEEQPPLIQAVFAGDADVVRNLLQNKEDVNYQDYEKRCALHAAAFKGDAAITKLLLEYGARVNTKDCKWLTPLHRACCTGSEETVSVLLNNSADTSARDRLWQTPLHIAAAFNALECLSYLLEKIPNPNVTDRSGRIALHHAVLNGHNDVVELLISKGCIINACDKKDCRPIHWAAHMGHTDTIELLLRNGADINARDRNQYTPLHVAAASGMVGACRILIAYGAHLEAQNAYGNTSLHIGCLNGHLSVCEELVANGADKEAQNYRGQTPLHIAAASTHGVHCLNFLVANNVNINRQSIDGRTPLHMTAIHGRFTRSKTLIDKGAIVDCLDKNSCTALHIAAQHGHELLSNTLLSYGANASRRGYEGRTPLHMCCLSGYVECCRAFIKAGVDINCQDDTGKTPTHCAAYKGSVECLDLLVSSGANFKMVDLIGRTPLHYSAAQGYFFCVFTLVGIGSSVNQVDAEGCAPLHLAAAYDLEGRCIDYLIQHKANPKMKDCNGFTPVHYAVAGSNVVGLKYLLEAVGSSYLLSGPDMPSTTPLHIAAKNGNMDILEKLMPYFPDPNIRNEYGCTPLLLAAREGFANCVQFLLRFGAKVSICDSINRLSSVHHSAKNGHVHCLALLVDNAEDKSIIDMPDELQRTALMLAVSGSHDDCVTTLIKSGADPNVLDGNAHSCLFRAVVTGQHNILQLLLPRSSMVNNPDVNGKTVLHVAAACGRLACIQRILPYMDREVAAGGDNEKFTALHWACYSGSSDCVGHFLKEGVYKTLNGNLFSAVHCATSAGSEKCLELLCNHYGPEIVQMRDSRMRTPLHIAALHGHTECTKYLLEQGAEIDTKDEDGRSPLIAASQNGQVQVIEILISYKADVTLYDNNGNTALHLACLRKHNHAALLLLEFIDDPDIINMINNDRRTPLHLSARNGLVDVTRQLIMKGSSVTAVDANGLTPALACAPNPSVAQCLAIILASHPDQGLLKGNNGKELIQFFPTIDSPSQKTNVTQTEITLIKDPDQFELEHMFELKFSQTCVSKDDDSSMPTIMHPYLGTGELKLRKKKKPQPPSKSKEEDCFIIESYDEDDKSSDKFFGLGRDLHKSQSDMTLTTKTIYSEEDYGRIIQNTRAKIVVENLENKRNKMPVKKEQADKGKVRLRSNNSKSEEDKKFLRRPGSKAEEMQFRKIDGLQEYIDVACGIIDGTSNNNNEQHKRSKLDESKLKLPRPTVKKMKAKKVEEDDCSVCKLVTQRVIDSDFKPERIKQFSATLDRAKEELIASKNNNRCLRAFLDQAYDLNEANRTAIYHGMLQPKCEPYIAKLLNLPAKTPETSKLTESKDKTKIGKAKFVKAKITKPKVKSEEAFKKHEDGKVTQPRVNSKTIEAVKIKDLKKRKAKEKPMKHKTVECASENALQTPNGEKSPEETTIVYCRPGFIDNYMRNQEVKATVSDLQKDMSVSTFIDGRIIDNCGENTFRVTGDVLKKQTDADAELKQADDIMDLSNKNFPEYLKTLTSFHLNPMFVNEVGKTRCYPTYWCFPELDDNEGPDDAVGYAASVKPRDKSYSDSGLLSKNFGEFSGTTRPITNGSAQTNIICVKSEVSMNGQLKETGNLMQKNENESGNECNGEDKTIDEVPDKIYISSRSSTSKENETFWQDIDLNSTSNDCTRENHDILYFNDNMADESMINISDRSSKYSKESDSEIATSQSKINIEEMSLDENINNNININIVPDDECSKLDKLESKMADVILPDEPPNEEIGDTKQDEPHTNSAAVPKSSDHNDDKLEQNAVKIEIENQCESKPSSLNNKTKKPTKLQTNSQMSENETKLSQEVERVRTNYKQTLAKLTKDLNRLTDPTHYYPIDRKEDLSVFIERTAQDLSARNLHDKSKNIVSEIISCINLGLKQKEKMIENRDVKQTCAQNEINEVKLKNLSIKTFTYDADLNKTTGDLKDVNEKKSLDAVPINEDVVKNEVLNKQIESKVKKSTTNSPDLKDVNEQKSLDAVPVNEDPVLNKQSGSKVQKSTAKQSTPSIQSIKVTNEDRIINLKLYLEHRSNIGQYKPYREPTIPLEEPPQVVAPKIRKTAKKEFRQRRTTKNEDRAKLKLSQKDQDLKFEECEDFLKIDDVIRNEEKKKGAKGRKVLFSEDVVILEDKETTVSSNESNEIKEQELLALEDTMSYDVKEDEIEAICQSIASTVIEIEKLKEPICSKLDAETFTKVESEERSVQVFASKDDVTEEIIASTDFASAFKIEEDGRGNDEKSEVSVTYQAQSEVTDDASIAEGGYDLEENFSFKFDAELPFDASEGAKHGRFTVDDVQNTFIDVEGASSGTIEAVFDENEQRILGEYEGQLIGELDEATMENEPRMYGEGDVLSLDDAEEESTFDGYDETSIEEYEERLSEGSSDMQLELSDIPSDHSNDHIEQSEQMDQIIVNNDIGNEHSDVCMEHNNIDMKPPIEDQIQLTNVQLKEIELCDKFIEDTKKTLMEHDEITTNGYDVIAQNTDILEEHSDILEEQSDILEEHSNVLEEHSNILDEHCDTLSEQLQHSNVHIEIVDSDPEIEHTDQMENSELNIDTTECSDLDQSEIQMKSSEIQKLGFDSEPSVEIEPKHIEFVEDHDLVEITDPSCTTIEYECSLENITEENDQLNEVDTKPSEHNLKSDGTEDFEDAEIFDLEETDFDAMTPEVYGDVNFYDAEAKMDPLFEVDRRDDVEIPVVYLKEEIAPDFILQKEYDQLESLKVHEEVVPSNFLQEKHEGDVEYDEVYIREDIIPKLLLPYDYEPDVMHGDQFYLEKLDPQEMPTLNKEYVEGAEPPKNIDDHVYQDQTSIEQPLTDDTDVSSNEANELRNNQQDQDNLINIELPSTKFFQNIELPVSDDQQDVLVQDNLINVELPSTKFFQNIEDDVQENFQQVRNVTFIENIDSNQSNSEDDALSKSDNQDVEKRAASKGEKDDEAKRVKSKRSFPSLGKLGKKAKKDSNCKIS